jgi:methyl-accepting chemotaxis protein
MMKMSVGAKVISLFMVGGLVPVIAIGLTSYNSASTSLKDQAMQQLTSVREMKKADIEDYFSTIRKQVRTFSENKMIVNAMLGFKSTFKEFRKQNEITDSTLNGYRSAVRSYYTGDFAGEYKNRNSGKRADGLGYFNQLDDDSIALQYHYIKANPNPLGEKHNLDAAEDDSIYSQLHARYHPVIRDYLEQFEYYDIFLVDTDTGDIVYSVYKELDYSTSLKDGPYAKTNFGRVFNEANNSGDPHYIKLVDFEPYPPSYEDAASFIASPIYDGSEKVGVLIFQMPIDKINGVMTSGNDWKNVGLGESGETYIVGDDFSMRNQSRFLIEDAEGYFAMMRGLGTAQGLLDTIRAKGSTILLQKVKTKGTQAAISGTTGAEIFPDYRDIPVLSAYAPLAIEDVKWAIMSEIDETEALVAAIALRNKMLMMAIGIVLGVGALGYLVTRITGRVTELLKGLVHELSEGSTNIASASGQISASSQSLSQGTTEQAASVEETSASMEEMASMTKQNADHAREAAQLAASCNKSAEEGDQLMVEMNDAMGEIDQSGKKIGEIIRTIDGIAFQTNLLALNAAVEAARAGEHGKGFAVVAEEVRNLAQRSAAAAKDTTSLINESLHKTESGTGLAKRCTESFQNIVANIKKMTGLVNEISAASGEQSQGVEQVSKAIQQIDQALQSSVANAEETAAAGEQLTSQSQVLKNLVSRIANEAGVGNGNGSVKKEEKQVRRTALSSTRRAKPLIAPDRGVAQTQSHNRLNQELFGDEVYHTASEIDDGGKG